VVALWPPRPGAIPQPAAGAPGVAPGSAPGGVADNAASLVLEAGEGAGRALLLADADSTVEQALAVQGGVALIKVAHHGAGSSSGALALARLRPRAAAISCGRRNPFGHPDRGALARIAASGARVFRTDREGTLWFELSERGIRSLDWRRGEPWSRTEQDPNAGGSRPLAGALAAAKRVMDRRDP
jgi:competence protein ComEC